MKSAGIVQYLASDAVRRQEDKYALQLQQQALRCLPCLLKNFKILLPQNISLKHWLTVWPRS